MESFLAHCYVVKYVSMHDVDHVSRCKPAYASWRTFITS